MHRWIVYKLRLIVFLQVVGIILRLIPVGVSVFAHMIIVSFALLGLKLGSRSSFLLSFLSLSDHLFGSYFHFLLHSFVVCLHDCLYSESRCKYVPEPGHPHIPVLLRFCT